jgi:hypothetical protein
MKAISSLSLAAALVLAGIAFAQSPPPNTTEDAPPAAKTAPASRQSDSPSPATMSPSAADTNQASPQSLAQACRRQASEQKLTGDEKRRFLKDCKQHGVSHSGN